MEEKEFNPDVELEQENNDENDTQENEQVDYDKEIEEARAEAAKWKAIAERNRKKTKPLQSKPAVDDDIVATVKNLEQIEKKRQFGFEHNLSPEETDYVFRFTNGKPDGKALENPFVKAGLEGIRSAKRLENNTPSPSGGSSIYAGKSFAEMDEDARRKAFAEASKNVKKPI